MISNLEHGKTEKQRLQMRIDLRELKTLKSKVRKMLPSDFIKLNKKRHLVTNQKGQKVFRSISQTEIEKFYNFSQLSVSEIQKILYNPLYYLQNQRNLRIFKMYLYKSNLVKQLEDLASLNAEKTNSLNYRKNIIDFQFQDKKKANYRDPWQYIAQKTDMSNIYERRNLSSKERQRTLLTKNSFFNTINSYKSEPKLNILKSFKPLKTTSKLLINSYHLNTSQNLIEKKSLSKRKFDLFTSRQKKQQEGRRNYFNKLSNAQIKMMQLREQTTQKLKKRSQTLENRINSAKQKRSRLTHNFCQVVEKSIQIRQKCLDTMKQRKQKWQMTKKKRVQQIRSRNQKLKSYLQLKLNLNL